ncbi:MAG: hypothetical protein OEV88_12780 [Gammaproteobacteria bacterium]|nr:hypothetical protein [Gammaproteobacteria bacterium]
MPVAEIMPVVLQGYLPMKPPMQSVVFVPASPQERSAQQAVDDQVSAYARHPALYPSLGDGQARCPSLVSRCLCSVLP